MTGLMDDQRPARRASAPLALPPGVLPLAVFLLLVLAYGPNLRYVLLSIAVLLAGSALLWRPGENPVLLFLFGYQWLQASALIFLGNARDQSLTYISKYPGQTDTATALALIGLLVFAVALRAGAGPQFPERNRQSRLLALQQPVRRWFWLYVAAALIGVALRAGAWIVPGLSQPLMALAGLKWAFFFVLAFVAIARGQALHPLFLLAFFAEFAAGVGGYFSDFKTVFFVAIMAAVMARVRLSLSATLGLGAAVLALLVVSVTWTAVKADYRAFVSGGETAQVVNVDYGTRLTKLADLIGDLDKPAIANGAETLVRRLAYVEFFGAVLNEVPIPVPYAKGAILADAISRPFMPRLFFPNKAAINDSDRTNEYTGLGVAGADRGTSISLGWLAEAYIDFGKLGMFVEVFGVGLAYGLIYRLFVNGRNASPLLGGAMALAVLVSAAALESSLTKVVGGVAVGFLMAVILVRWGLPAVCPWALNMPPRLRARLG